MAIAFDLQDPVKVLLDRTVDLIRELPPKLEEALAAHIDARLRGDSETAAAAKSDIRGLIESATQAIVDDVIQRAMEAVKKELLERILLETLLGETNSHEC